MFNKPKFKLIVIDNEGGSVKRHELDFTLAIIPSVGDKVELGQRHYIVRERLFNFDTDQIAIVLSPG